MSLEPDGSRSNAEESAPVTLAELTACHEEQILRFVSSQVDNDATAAEVSQEVWVKICKQWPKFDRCRGTAETWVFQIARSVLIDQNRRSTTKKRHPEGGTVNSIDGAELAELAKCADSTPQSLVDERLWLLQAMDRLHSFERAIVSLFLAGKTTAEIAEQLGKTKASVDTKLWRIQERLKKEYEREELWNVENNNTGGAA